MDAVKESKKSPAVKVKEYWVSQPKKRKLHIVILLVVLVLVAVAATVVLNFVNPGYVVLYPGLDASESQDVYAALRDMNVPVQQNSTGDIMVPKEQYDKVLLELAAQGYPKTALPYNVFYDHNSLTSTEFEQKQSKLYELQDRMQNTLKRIDGVELATVTLSIPDDNDYVWQQASSENQSKASVLLTLRKGVTLGDDEVSAIKNLVAAGTPKLLPENVKVVDGATSLELGASTTTTGSLSTNQSLRFEQQVQTQLQDAVIHILAGRYGKNGVIASAKATIDYDKMMQERKELLNTDGYEASVIHREESYHINGNVPAAGVVGEEDNTDIPTYGQNDPTGENGMTVYGSSTDYDVGYIKTQIEKGAATLERATISVMVNEPNLEDSRAELMDLISKATDIPVENISLAAMNLPPVDNIPGNNEDPGTATGNDMWMYLLIGVAGLLVLLFIVIMLVLFRRRTKRIAAQVAAEKDSEMENRAQSLEDEIAQYKRQLEDAARANSNPKDDAITDEVRGFAKENPEITANLLRSWLKEDE